MQLFWPGPTSAVAWLGTYPTLSCGQYAMLKSSYHLLVFYDDVFIWKLSFQIRCSISPTQSYCGHKLFSNWSELKGQSEHWNRDVEKSDCARLCQIVPVGLNGNSTIICKTCWARINTEIIMNMSLDRWAIQLLDELHAHLEATKRFGYNLYLPNFW